MTIEITTGILMKTLSLLGSISLIVLVVEVASIPAQSSNLVIRPAVLAQAKASDYLLSGLEKVRKRNFNGAIEDYTQAIKLDPEYEKAYYNRGLANFQIGELDAAVADFSKTVLLDRDHVRAYYHRGRTYSVQEDFEAAILDFTQAIQMDPSFAKAYKNRAQAYTMIGALSQARSDYETALSLFEVQEEAQEVEKVREKLDQL